ncbi:MAG TPA: cytochrome b/b6 domain-containing protein [Aquabacterium sp.]|nr:cytochrome b/b6 domain-containing protein [Aquabacterium sp.]
MNTVSAYRDEPITAPPSRRVIDAPTRVFHWLLALCFAGAYVTSEGERWRLVHITMGYSMIGLMGFRLIWFIVGPRPSRLGAWRARFKAFFQAASVARTGSIKWSPLQMGLNTVAVVGVMWFTLIAIASGYAVDREWFGDALEEVHEFAGNGLLMLVLAHIALVMFGWALRAGGRSWAQMFTGRVAGRGPDLVPHNRVWLGVLMLAGVVAFWTYQWQGAPSGPADLSGTRLEHAHGDDEDD